jgi:hypothetical protein
MAAGALGFSSSALAESKTFEPGKGSEQEFKVPAGVTQLEVTAVGGAGQEGDNCNPEGGGAGGAGAKVSAVLTVSEGQTLYVDFGGGGKGGAVIECSQPGRSAGGGAPGAVPPTCAPAQARLPPG